MSLEKELCKRMGVDPEEVNKLHNKTRVDDEGENHEEIHC